jgi:hypothetical protein
VTEAALSFHEAKLLISNISGLAENYKTQPEQQMFTAGK